MADYYWMSMLWLKKVLVLIKFWCSSRKQGKCEFRLFLLQNFFRICILQGFYNWTWSRNIGRLLHARLSKKGYMLQKNFVWSQKQMWITMWIKQIFAMVAQGHKKLTKENRRKTPNLRVCSFCSLYHKEGQCEIQNFIDVKKLYSYNMQKSFYFIW
jgi:hypothetical protein